MKFAELEKKLIAVARANPPSDRVPLAFEKRIMSLIFAQPVYDLWAAWSKALWRAAAPCVAVMLLFGAWAMLHPVHEKPAIDLAQQFDKTLFAAVDQDNDSPW